MGHPHARRSELSPSRRVGAVAVGLAQVTLTAAAYRDLARRPAEEVNGTKLAWGLAILVNWIGPIAYFGPGRRRARPPGEETVSLVPNTNGWYRQRWDFSPRFRPVPGV